MSEYDFSKCYIDVSKLQKGKNLAEVFPELKHIKDFTNLFNWYEFPIIVSISDINSPFINIRDPKEKLEAIFEYFEVGLKTEANKQYFNEVLFFSTDKIKGVITRYLMMMGNHIWASYFGLYQTFYQLTAIMIAPLPAGAEAAKVATGQKLAIQKSMDDIQEKLAKYESSLFGDDRLKNLLMSQETAKIVSYPEKYAEEDSVI